MSVTMQYLVHHVLNRQQLAPPLQLDRPEWTEVVNGNGTFRGTLVLPKNQAQRDQLKTALEPDTGAIYAKSPSGTFMFGGPIIDQEWKPGDRTVTVTAVSWRSWLYYVFFGPKTDLTGDNVYSVTNRDQLQIARELVALALVGGTTEGRPYITINSELSGKNRDLSVKGLDFRYYGELIDSMARRSGGFEWGVETYADNVDGMPRLRLVFGYPQRGSVVPGMLLMRTPAGGNFSTPDTIKVSSVDRRNRVWATGNTETLPFAQDTDPDLAFGAKLLREKVTSYSTVQDRTTLAQHARGEREYRSVPLNLLTVDIQEKAFDFTSYRAGDRCRLVYQDDWYDIDLPAVRILDREVVPQAGAGTIRATLDLSDFELPEVDAGGLV